MDKLATLSWLISRYSEKTLPSFAAIKKGKDFRWTEECLIVLDKLKSYSNSPPLMSKQESNEELLFYLSVSN